MDATQDRDHRKDPKDFDRNTRGGRAEDGQPLDRMRLPGQPEPIEPGEAPENAPDAADWHSDKVIGNRRRDSAQGLLDDEPPVQ